MRRAATARPTPLPHIMRAQLVLAIAASAMAACQLSAQSVGKMFVDDIRWAGQDFAAIWLSPFKGEVRDYLISGAVLGASAALSPLDDDVDRWAVKNRDRGFLDALSPIRSGGDFYSLNKATPYVGAAYLVALATKHRGLRDGIFGCASAYAAGTTIRHQVVYRVLGRDRPDTVRDWPEGVTGPPAEHGDQYRFDVPASGWASHSFPGGHVATMATCASFFAHRYDAPYADPVLIGLVTAMGIGRIADRGHWLSDQLVGTAMGFAIGKEVARRQLRRLAKEQRTSSADQKGESTREPRGEPIIIRGANGTLLGWSHAF
jgi:membrane-associated phospholipid phosphatase